ncbi:MAG TPA: hypothetical protein VGN72_14615 [Tepidisphaeraceae bacterium]|jgi:hypothetical protein|nr:hypothetical protein [Tepidisphaeraceae bacterium]
MLHERGELLYGDAAADIAEFLRYSWPFDFARFDPVDVNGQPRLIVWVNVEAGALAVSRKDDPADVLHFVAGCERRWRSRGSRRMICSCGSDLHEVTAGHQVDATGRDVWIVTGTRCPECGLLASPVDWNVESGS